MRTGPQKILDRIADEPAYRHALYKMLEFCKTQRFLSDIDTAVREYPEMQAAVHEPVTLLGWLEGVGAVESVETDGAGCWVTSEAGRVAAESMAPQPRLGVLLSQNPGHSHIYRQVLDFCRTPQPRMAIEALLESDPLLSREHLLPAYFVQHLENVGALEWNGQCWQRVFQEKT